ncbi:MAG: 23S rRNA (uracil(1939)-C(5))-methyltransferase RlmD [bacterium]
MKLYQEYTGKIAALDQKGRGILPISNDKQLQIYFTYPGDEVKAISVKRQKGEIIGRLEELLEPSEDRVAPICAHAGVCGGCLWQGFSYEAQLAAKEALVRGCFKDAGLDCPILKVVPATSQFNYRNRMDYVVSPKGEVGLKEPGRYNCYLDLKECHLLSKEASELLQKFRSVVHDSKLPPYDSKTGKGFWRYFVVREGKRTHERLIHAITTSQFDLPSDFNDRLAPFATSLLWGLNDGISDLSSSERNVILKGADSFLERANGIEYQIPAQSFFQTNTEMAEQLFSEIQTQLKAEQTILDLYCGVGFFTLPLAKAGKNCLGVEIDEKAIQTAQTAAEANQCAQATFRAARAEDLSWAKENVEAVIIDPPRAGLHPKVLAKLLEMRPKKIIYVSCKYSRLVQELPEFLKCYKLAGLTLVDLFPQTPHVEAIANLNSI